MFEKKVWITGEMVYARDVNRIEDGVYDAHQRIDLVDSSVESAVEAVNSVNGAIQSGQLRGRDGLDGRDGEDGRHFQINAFVENLIDRPAASLDYKDQVWVVYDTGNIYYCDGEQWVDWGRFVGLPGERGKDGAVGNAFTIKGVLPGESYLPTVGKNGDAYWIGDMIYTWTDDQNAVVEPTWQRGPSLRGPSGTNGTNGKDGEGVTITTGTVTISSALNSRGGRISDVVLQKQGLFNRLSMSFYNGDTTQQAAGTRLIVGTIPEGFRPAKVVHTHASDNGSSNYPRHAVFIDPNGNIIWIPQAATGYFTMSFSVVY